MTKQERKLALIQVGTIKDSFIRNFKYRRGVANKKAHHMDGPFD